MSVRHYDKLFIQDIGTWKKVNNRKYCWGRNIPQRKSQKAIESTLKWKPKCMFLMQKYRSKSYQFYFFYYYLFIGESKGLGGREEERESKRK